MSKQKIKEWLDETSPLLHRDKETYAVVLRILEKHEQDQSGWTDANTAKPEGPMAVDGYGFIAGGYSHGDQSRWTDIFYDNKKEVWWYWGEDMERVDITGFTMTHWTRPALPPTEEV